MSKFRLNDNHEFSKRFSELCQKADELGIDIEFPYSNTSPTVIRDQKNEKDYYLVDIDSNEAVSTFPPYLDYKIIYEKL